MKKKYAINLEKENLFEYIIFILIFIIYCRALFLPLWDKEDSKYEANFAKDGKTMSATFDANGTLEETETDIAMKELPSAIASYVQTHYKGERIKEAAMITKPNGEKMYEAEVKGKDLLFDMQGKFLKEEKD